MNDIAQAIIDSFESYDQTGQYWLDMMHAAYLRNTGLDPLRVALLETELGDGRTLYQFVDKEDVFHDEL